MKQLLDTHTFIWFVMGNPKISTEVRTQIENNENLLSKPFRVFIEQQTSLNSIDLLNINLNHIDIVAMLPLHHRDPFDRLLIAQAMVEQIPILSADSAFDAYSIQRLW